MILRGRCAAVVGGGVAAVVMSAGAVAWACTPDEGITYTPESPPAVSQDRSQPQPQPQPQTAADPAPAPVVATAPAPAPAPVAVATPKAPRPVRSTRTASSAPVRRTARPATASDGGAPPPAAVTADAPAGPSLPSMGTVAGDLWSGFNPVPSSAATGPGLTTPSPAGTSGHSGELALGVGLLGAGLVALGAGTGLTVLRRSRVRVAAGSR